MKKNDLSAKKYSCILVDDESAATGELSKQLLNFNQIEIVDVINDSELAVSSILKHKPDLLFLDIQMPGMDGFQVLEILNQTGIKPFVIFVTAFDKFAIQAVRAAAFDYLLKPVIKNELLLALERFNCKHEQQEQEKNYLALLEHTNNKKIKFNTIGGFSLINPQDIIYIQADWNYSKIHFSKNKFELVAINLGNVETLLPTGSFARINRSVIVNINCIDKIQRAKRKCILKKDGETFEFKIPILRIRFIEELF